MNIHVVNYILLFTRFQEVFSKVARSCACYFTTLTILNPQEVFSPTCEYLFTARRVQKTQVTVNSYRDVRRRRRGKLTIEWSLFTFRDAGSFYREIVRNASNLPIVDIMRNASDLPIVDINILLRFTSVHACSAHE